MPGSNACRASKGGGFKRVSLWVAPKSDPVPVKRTRLGATDIDYDGRTDLVLYSYRTEKNSRMRTLKARYDRMLQGPNIKVSIPWSAIYPY